MASVSFLGIARLNASPMREPSITVSVLNSTPEYLKVNIISDMSASPKDLTKSILYIQKCSFTIPFVKILDFDHRWLYNICSYVR